MAGVVVADEVSHSPKYEETWESLKRHSEEPEWLKDAKFGIYTHWGPATYPASLAVKVAGWYPRRMYEKSHNNFGAHLRNFGDQNDIGFKDLIPLFKADKFDAAEWAGIFKKSGAKFAGPVAVHHDNFCLWDSKATRWNSVRMGPKRDITGELAKAIRAEGMKFFVSMHHSYTWHYYYAAYRFDAKDPQYADLYGTPHKKDTPPDEMFMKAWHGKIREVIDQYEPDILYFDWGLGMLPEADRLKMVAYCYNQAAAAGRDFSITYKRRDLAEGVGLYDYELHYPMEKTEHFWLTDLSVSNWFRNKNSKWGFSDGLVDRLIDIVSKNGSLVLNVPPDCTGEIPEKAREILRGIGAWLEVNGEAIYNTRPYDIYGYGPYSKMTMKAATTPLRGGDVESRFCSDDVRFTRSKDGTVVYAMLLGAPGSNRVVIRKLEHLKGKISKIALLGNNAPLKWNMSDTGLSVTLPEHFDFKYALALSIHILNP